MIVTTQRLLPSWLRTGLGAAGLAAAVVYLGPGSPYAPDAPVPVPPVHGVLQGSFLPVCTVGTDDCAAKPAPSTYALPPVIVAPTTAPAPTTDAPAAAAPAPADPATTTTAPATTAAPTTADPGTGASVGPPIVRGADGAPPAAGPLPPPPAPTPTDPPAPALPPCPVGATC